MTKIRFSIFLLSLITIISAFGCSDSGVPNKKVLFIGNSLTYYNDMPKMLQQMLNEDGAGFIIEQSTFPGYSLRSHLNNMVINSDDPNEIFTRAKNTGEITDTEKKLKENTYDIIVLQERSGQMLIPKIVETETIPAIKRIEEMVEGNATELWFYQTFPSFNKYPKNLCRTLQESNESVCSVTLNSLEEEMQTIRNGVKNIDDEVVQIGEIFYQVMNNHKNITLNADNIHPSEEGSFLMALMFYYKLTGNDPTKLEFNGGLDNETAATLKKVVSDFYETIKK